MRFRLVTYNIHRAIGVDRQFRPERIVAILRRYDPDIVLLQEVDVGVPRSRHMNLAAHIAHELDYPHRAVGLNVFYKRGKYGNATLSRFPIGRQRNIDLTLKGGKGRGAQHTAIHLPAAGGRVDLEIFNIHLSLSARLRVRQVRHLLHAEDVGRLAIDTPCIVAGDMNDWRGVLKRKLFVPVGFRCATNHRPDSRWSLRTFPSFAPAGGLDKIFYRGRLRLIHVARSRLELARVASDHLPVIADFETE
jgi:endonuclease/exonuclease/phosphatase family metal-dependent hydrolase